MHSIVSHSIPLKNVIHDLAEELGTTVHHNCDEYTIFLPATWGKGCVKGIDFKGGHGIILYDCIFKEDIEIRFIVNKIHPLKFLFCEEGQLTHRFEDEVELHALDVLENIIVASSQKQGHILRFKAGVRTKINSLEIIRSDFIKNVDCELKSLEPRLQNLFRDVDAKHVFYHKGNYSVKMADLFIEIAGFPESDFLRRIFLEGSAFKVLTLQIQQYRDDVAKTGNKSLLRKSEMERIRNATAIIDREILDFKSVLQLAHQVGLNTNKLQTGFKALYGTTVNDYVQNRRLDVANSLLRKSDYTISEIVYLIGLSSKSYFSKIFKEKYGVPPSVARKKI